MAERSATTLWHVSAEIVLALEAHHGPPVDCFVNGSQTWLTADGPGGITLEWRLHPVAGYQQPAGLSHYDVFEEVVAALSAGATASELVLGAQTRELQTLWDGLECFAAYGDDVEPQPLAAAASTALGIAPDYSGLVDHQAIGDEWERTGGAVSIVALLTAALQTA